MDTNRISIGPLDSDSQKDLDRWLALIDQGRTHFIGAPTDLAGACDLARYRDVRLAEVAGQIVGTVTLEPHTNWHVQTELRFFVVDEGHRRCGIGTALMQDATERCAGSIGFSTFLIGEYGAILGAATRFGFHEYSKRATEAPDGWVTTSTGERIKIEHDFVRYRFDR